MKGPIVLTLCGLAALMASGAETGRAASSPTVLCPGQSLQAAIDGAPAGSVITVAGTCVGNFTVSKDLTLQALVLATQPPILDGKGSGNTLAVTNQATVHLIGITIRHGVGSGIFNDRSTLTLDRVTVKANSTGILNNGGFGSASLTVSASTVSDNSAAGIINAGSFGNASLTITGSTVSKNDSGGYRDGGGIFNAGYSGSASLTVAHSIISGNTAASLGGGIFNYTGWSGSASLTMTDSIVSGNKGGEGGGLYNSGTYYYGSASATLTNSTVSNNIATGRGGGIYNDGGRGNNTGGFATLTLDSSTVSANAAKSGGGIYNDGGFYGHASVALTGSAISGNAAVDGGGGVYDDCGSLDCYGGGQAITTLTNSTVSNNTATNGGGIYGDGGYYDFGGPWLTIAKSTVANNQASNLGGGIYSSQSDRIYLSQYSRILGNTAHAPAPSGGGILLACSFWGLNNDGTADVSGNAPDDTANIC